MSIRRFTARKTRRDTGRLDVRVAVPNIAPDTATGTIAPTASEFDVIAENPATGDEIGFLADSPLDANEQHPSNTRGVNDGYIYEPFFTVVYPAKGLPPDTDKAQDMDAGYLSSVDHNNTPPIIMGNLSSVFVSDEVEWRIEATGPEPQFGPHYVLFGAELAPGLPDSEYPYYAWRQLDLGHASLVFTRNSVMIMRTDDHASQNRYFIDVTVTRGGTVIYETYNGTAGYDTSGLSFTVAPT